MDDFRIARYSSLRVRDAMPADFPEIAAIYAHHVLHGVASFEETPPTVDEMLRRRATVLGHGLPWLVAEMAGRPVGYSYAAPYRSRSAYRYTVEDSIYVAAACCRQGIGRALLAALIARCEEGPWRQMIAVIADSASGSPELHRRAGFEPIGVLRNVGFKHGQWRDSMLMQRALGKGALVLPDEGAQTPRATLAF